MGLFVDYTDLDSESFFFLPDPDPQHYLKEHRFVRIDKLKLGTLG